jgi:hypothetical protein
MSTVTSNIIKVAAKITNVLKPNLAVTNFISTIPCYLKISNILETILAGGSTSHTSLKDFVLGHTLPVTQLLQHNKRKTLD